MCHALKIQIQLFTTTFFWSIPLSSNILLTYIQKKCRNTCTSSCKLSVIVIILYSQMKDVNISVENPVSSFIKIHVVVFGFLPLNWLGDMKILWRVLLQISAYKYQKLGTGRSKTGKLIYKQEQKRYNIVHLLYIINMYCWCSSLYSSQGLDQGLLLTSCIFPIFTMVFQDYITLMARSRGNNLVFKIYQLLYIFT